jgi:hypothetical protein
MRGHMAFWHSLPGQETIRPPGSRHTRGSMKRRVQSFSVMGIALTHCFPVEAGLMGEGEPEGKGLGASEMLGEELAERLGERLGTGLAGAGEPAGTGLRSAEGLGEGTEETRGDGRVGALMDGLWEGGVASVVGDGEGDTLRMLVLIVFPSRVTAVCARMCPLREAPVFITTAVAHRMVPSKWAPVPMVVCPATCQKTLAACAPPVRRMDVLLPITRFWAIWKIQTSLGFPWSVTSALMSTCELHLYTPGVSVNPLMSPAPRSTKLGGVRLAASV